VGVAALSWYSKLLVARRVYEIAGARYTQKDLGLVVQREAVKRSDILPLFGSSEIEAPRLNHARDLFADAPTGFSVLAVAGPGEPVFLTLQNLAALGRDLEGKNVAISLSPHMFQFQEGAELQRRYRGNFSPLHALSLVLSPDLSAGLKQGLARRMLARPDLLERNPVLALLTAMVADGSVVGQSLFRALAPLGQLQRHLLETQDKLLVLGHLLTTPYPALARPRPRPIDWEVLFADTTARLAPLSTNKWSVDDKWLSIQQEWTASQKNAQSDERFLADFKRSDTTLDFEQLLQVLSELRAKPLIMSVPFHGAFVDHMGVSAPTRRQYYALVRRLAARYGARTALFDDLESEPYFFYDLFSHPSAKGWLYYDRALDAFYHDALN
jgi:D-alanyl-lipoteichoic acid biosynthesis protein DltD